MYEAFYHLDGKPFRLTPDAGILFPSRGHKRAMSYLLYGLNLGEGFVMITGAVGTGKTLLIQKLLGDLAHLDIPMASIASANLHGEDILPAVASEFGIAFEGRAKESLLQDVKKHLIELGEHHAHALLIVDEAQTLAPEALEMLRILSNFEIKGRALLQVFLVGQTELRSIMVGNHLEQLRQRIVASYRFEPLEAHECREYILYRLRAVGWNDDPVLAPEVFDAVHQASRGIPRKINLIMDRLLLYGYLENQHQLDHAALSIVLREMRDEMPDVPQTLEPDHTTPPSTPDQGDVPPASKEALATLGLELKYNKMLLRLIREEIRLKEMLASTDSQDSRPEKPAYGKLQPIPSGRKEE